MIVPRVAFSPLKQFHTHETFAYNKTESRYMSLKDQSQARRKYYIGTQYNIYIIRTNSGLLHWNIISFFVSSTFIVNMLIYNFEMFKYIPYNNTFLNRSSGARNIYKKKKKYVPKIIESIIIILIYAGLCIRYNVKFCINYIFIPTLLS